MNLRPPSTPTRTRRFVPLPVAPKTGSPVPELTSIHSTVERGPYGNSKYRGNCGGYLIRDLLNYFQPRRVLDPMTGSGTCRDVCRELSIECASFDLNAGDDAADPASYKGIGSFDFVWLHPPYWRMIRYGDDARCLSLSPSLEDFMDSLGRVLTNGRSVLSSRGVIAVLIGGYTENGSHIPLPALTTMTAIENGLWPAGTEIVRFQHGNTSSSKTYRSRFIPGLHDTCILLRRRRHGDPSLN